MDPKAVVMILPPPPPCCPLRAWLFGAGIVPSMVWRVLNLPDGNLAVVLL